MFAKKYLALVFLAASACAMDDRPLRQPAGDRSGQAPVARTKFVTECGHEVCLKYLPQVLRGKTCPTCGQALSLENVPASAEAHPRLKRADACFRCARCGGLIVFSGVVVCAGLMELLIALAPLLGLDC